MWKQLEKHRYLVVSWGKADSDRCDPLNELDFRGDWIDLEVLPKDETVRRSFRYQSSTPWWQDECMITVPAAQSDSAICSPYVCHAMSDRSSHGSP